MGARWLDRRRRLYLVPFQWQWALDAAGLSVKQAEESLWTVSPDGRRVSGAEAVNMVIDALIGGNAFSKLYSAPLIDRLQVTIYSTVARNRSVLPGVMPAVDRPEGWKPQR